MGQYLFKPKKIVKCGCKISTSYEKASKQVPCYNYEENLKLILDKIFSTYLKKPKAQDLVSRTYSKGAISRKETIETGSTIPRLDDITFFTDVYRLDELEEFLSGCSNSVSSGNEIELADDDFDIILWDKIMNGPKKHIEELTKSELQLLLEDKIHLKLAEKSEFINKLIAIMRKAIENLLISDIIDLTNDQGNPAISIAALNHNIKGVYYLMFKCNAKIPLHIFEEGGKTPFLMYFAKHGKIYKNDNKEAEYILLSMMNKIMELYPPRYLLDHLKEIDETTNLSLPHFLLNIYNSSIDLKEQIQKCISICLDKCPECADTLCTNMYDTRFQFNVYASIISNPEMEIETSEVLLRNRKAPFADADKSVLRLLIKVHQDRDKRKKLRKMIGVKNNYK